jgi:predicted nucleic acid-binding Zn ribbon protein
MDGDSPHTAAPVHIGRLMEDALARLRPGGDKALLDICQCWEALVGPAIAANARAVGLKDHLLLVDVASSVWMQQLQFLKAEMIARVNAGVPGAGIEKIRFRVSRR